LPYLLLCVQARSQESQLVFAHQQLEMRLQESQAQAAALDAAQHNTAQLQETLAGVTDELHKTRHEVDAGGQEGVAGSCPKASL
jgi:hypothetical protein